MDSAALSPALWRPWIGLPHAFGADPNDGQACDCLVMVWRVLEASGVLHPPLDPSWLELAADGRWPLLERFWREGTEPLIGPEPLAACLIRNGPAGLGVGVVVPDGASLGVLIVHHRRGVTWVPCHLLRLLYSRFR